MALKRAEAEERSKPESYDELFPGRFLKAGLFKGKEVTLRIVDVYQELMPDKKGTILNSEGERCKKQTILVVETPAGRKLEQEIALNKTNAIAVLLMFGKSLRGPGGWVGRLITFAPRVVEAFGEQTEAIRVVGSPELAEDVERAHRVGRSDKTFQLKKTLMPGQVRVVQTSVSTASAPSKKDASDTDADPFEREKASAAAIEEQHDPFGDPPSEDLGPTFDGRPL